MTKTNYLLLLIFITSATQINTMEVEPPCTTNFFAYNILPTEIINKLLVLCDMQSLGYLSLTNRYCQHYASMKTNPSLIDALGRKHFKDHRLYYLFFGCIHDIPKVVETALTCFKPNKEDEDGCSTIYPEKELLNQARRYIKEFATGDAIKLLPNYPYLRAYDKGALHFAICNCDNMLFRLLLKQPKINVNGGFNDPTLQSLLSIAGYQKKAQKEARFLDMLDLLLKHPDFSFDNINIPVFLGYNKKAFSLKIANHLFKQDDFNINQKNKDDQTILDLTIAQKNDPLLQILLAQSGIDLNIENNDGDTPLHLGVKTYYIEGIKALLADTRCVITKKNRSDETPLEYALKLEKLNKRFCNPEKKELLSIIIELLQNAAQK